MDPAEVSLGANQAPVALALPTYHSTRILALVASTLVVAVAVLRVLALIAVAPLLQDVASGIEITEADVESVMGLSVCSLLVPILTLVVWAFWLSRVVTVMPSLGLGYPPSTGDRLRRVPDPVLQLLPGPGDPARRDPPPGPDR